MDDGSVLTAIPSLHLMYKNISSSIIIKDRLNK